ncbi:MAG TPA: TonB-dependent receptor [Chitinophagaceae bacterium]|nr:TonB-dependent receptor [Chitinophagaceae bacterium]
MLLLLLALSAFAVQAQSPLLKEVSISVTGAEINKVISLLEGQTKTKFIFSPSAIQATRKISCNVVNKKLGDFLDAVFKPLSIDYKVAKEQILLFTAPLPTPPVVVTPVTTNETPSAVAKTSQFEVAGIVKDEKGEAVSSATVTEKGTKNSTSTDAKGQFTLKVKSNASVLEISSVGFTSAEFAISNQTFLNLALTRNSKVGDEVIVVGYGRQKKINNTGAIATIGTKELVQSPVANISNSLVGRMPGLFAQQLGGEPGNDASRIRIRGVGTFAGSTDPLILVDGIEVFNYNNIDPNEIESLTILKDASSTAVYGIRGANGVLIITTKRGKPGPPRVSYTFNEGINSFISLREAMNSGDYATAFNEGLKADAYVTGVPFTPRYSATDIELYRNGKDPIFHPSRDWASLLFRKLSTQMQHNLTVSGGQKKVKYFISGGYFQQQGLFKDLQYLVPEFNTQSVFKRYNLRSNFNFDITDRFKMALDISTQIETRSGNNHASTERAVRDILNAASLDGPGVVDGKIVNITSATQSQNPYVSLLFPGTGGGVKRSYRNYLNGSLRLDHDLGFITKGLSTHGTVAIQSYNDQTIANTKQLIYYTATPINGGPINGGTVNFVPNTTESQFNFSQTGTYNRRITAEAALDYARRFGAHSVTGLLLYNQQKTYDPSFTFRVPKAYQSFVGRVTYDYDSRYLLEFNAGYNGTENFAPGKRFGFFPAYSVGWVLSNEQFFPKKSAITFLKFRGSYGEVGNDQIGGNRFLYNPTSYTGYNAIYYFGNTSTNYNAVLGLREGATGNPNVTWERALKKDIGLEMRLFRDKIRITADVFSEKRDNILAVPQTISAIVGFIQPATNLGSMQNKGYEGDISYSDNIGKLNFRVGGNYSFARNKVLFRDEIPNTYAYQNRTGQRLGQNFVLIADGIFNSWDEVNDAKRPVYGFNSNKVQPGDIKYRDVNGDGLINGFDAVPYGYSNIPEITFGVSLALNYAGFDFSVLVQGVGNVSRYYLPNERQTGFGQNVPSATANYFSESWTQERYDQGLPINFPRFNVSSSPNTQTSSFWLADASYLRLKNAEIGYSAKPGLLKRIGVSSLRIYANANNLITWKKTYKGIDPESDSPDRSDTNLEPYPLVRTVNFGLNLNF